MKKMAVSEAKAKFLATVDKVCATGESVTLTKHGKAVAMLVPVQRDADKLFGSMRGLIEITGDIIAPANDPEDWKMLR
jgi:prevent-host-death family protein